MCGQQLIYIHVTLTRVRAGSWHALKELVIPMTDCTTMSHRQVSYPVIYPIPMGTGPSRLDIRAWTSIPGPNGGGRREKSPTREKSQRDSCAGTRIPPSLLGFSTKYVNHTSRCSTHTSPDRSLVQAVMPIVLVIVLFGRQLGLQNRVYFGV